jgi:signal transduction histidine kinase
VRVAFKVMLAVIVLVLCVLAIEARLRSGREAELFESDVRRNQHVLGRALAASTRMIWLRDGPNQAREILQASEAAEREIEVRIIDADGPEPIDGGDLPSSALERINEGDEVVQVSSETRPGTLITLVPLSIPNEDGLALELSTSMRDEDEFLQAGNQRFLSIAFAIAIVSAAAAMLVGAQLVGTPVRKLVVQARQIGRGDFRQAPPTRSTDELGQLGRELNLMARQLATARDELEAETRARVAATEQLRRADRLAAVGTLAAGLAHELGTPLHVVAGRAARAKKRIADAASKRDLESINEQCKRMEGIVRQLLTFARSESVERRREDVREVVERSLDLIEPLLTQRNVNLEVSPTEHPTVDIASEQIQQVLTNLVINAVQATADGGRIEVLIERGGTPAGYTDEADSPWVCISVQDDGPGIPEDDLPRLFDPFFTTKEVGKGVGLGLSVAHGIVADHDGVLQARNLPQGGARFELWLPEVA